MNYRDKIMEEMNCIEKEVLDIIAELECAVKHKNFDYIENTIEDLKKLSKNLY